MVHVLGGNGIDVTTLEGCCGACLCRHHAEKDKLVLCLFALRRAGLMKELVSIIIGAI
jgi:hypothetical protein